MIELYTGKPGSGKTYYLVYKLYRLSKRKNFNKKIYSNFFVKIPNLEINFYKNFNDLIDVENAIILMDEAQIYLNSRKWDILPEDFQYKLQQHRKDGIDIWASTQHEARLDTVFREIVNRFFVLKKIGPIFLVREYSPDDMKKTLKDVLSLDFAFFRKKIASMYDTLQKIDYKQDDEFLYKDIKLRICPKCGAKKYIS